MTAELLQLTRELVASPHFSYQPQMRLRNGAIVLDVDPLLGVLVYMDPHGLSRVRLHGVDTPDNTVCFPMFLTDDWLPDLEDDGTVGVLRGMAIRALKNEPGMAHWLTNGDTGESWARWLIGATPPPDR